MQHNRVFHTQAGVFLFFCRFEAEMLCVTVVCSSCHANCANMKTWQLHVVVLHRTARNCSEVRAASIFFVNLQIKFLFWVAPILAIDDGVTGCMRLRLRLRPANATAFSLYGNSDFTWETATAFHLAFFSDSNKFNGNNTDLVVIRRSLPHNQYHNR